MYRSVLQGKGRHRMCEAILFGKLLLVHEVLHLTIERGSRGTLKLRCHSFTFKLDNDEITNTSHRGQRTSPGISGYSGGSLPGNIVVPVGLQRAASYNLV